MSFANLEGLTDLPIHIAVVDPAGTITAVNERWREFGCSNGFADSEFGLGTNYYQVCENPQAASAGRLSGLAAQLRELLSGKLALLTFAYPCDSPTVKRWFILIGLPIDIAGFRGAALVHVDISDLLKISGLAPLAASDGWLDSRPTQPGAADWRKQLVAELETSLRRIIPEFMTDGGAGKVSRAAPSADGTKLDDRIRKALTARQHQILGLIGEGKTNPEIARELGTSPNTVKLHVSALLKRLELKNRTEAAALAARLPRP